MYRPSWLQGGNHIDRNVRFLSGSQRRNFHRSTFSLCNIVSSHEGKASSFGPRGRALVSHSPNLLELLSSGHDSVISHRHVGHKSCKISLLAHLVGSARMQFDVLFWEKRVVIIPGELVWHWVFERIFKANFLGLVIVDQWIIAPPRYLRRRLRNCLLFQGYDSFLLFSTGCNVKQLHRLNGGILVAGHVDAQDRGSICVSQCTTKSFVEVSISIYQ